MDYSDDEFINICKNESDSKSIQIRRTTNYSVIQSKILGGNGGIIYDIYTPHEYDEYDVVEIKGSAHNRIMEISQNYLSQWRTSIPNQFYSYSTKDIEDISAYQFNKLHVSLQLRAKLELLKQLQKLMEAVHSNLLIPIQAQADVVINSIKSSRRFDSPDKQYKQHCLFTLALQLTTISDSNTVLCLYLEKLNDHFNVTFNDVGDELDEDSNISLLNKTFRDSLYGEQHKNSQAKFKSLHNKFSVHNSSISVHEALRYPVPPEDFVMPPIIVDQPVAKNIKQSTSSCNSVKVAVVPTPITMVRNIVREEIHSDDERRQPQPKRVKVNNNQETAVTTFRRKSNYAMRSNKSMDLLQCLKWLSQSQLEQFDKRSYTMYYLTSGVVVVFDSSNSVNHSQVLSTTMSHNTTSAASISTSQQSSQQRRREILFDTMESTTHITTLLASIANMSCNIDTATAAFVPGVRSDVNKKTASIGTNFTERMLNCSRTILYSQGHIDIFTVIGTYNITTSDTLSDNAKRTLCHQLVLNECLHCRSGTVLCDKLNSYFVSPMNYSTCLQFVGLMHTLTGLCGSVTYVSMLEQWFYRLIDASTLTLSVTEMCIIKALSVLTVFTPYCIDPCIKLDSECTDNARKTKFDAMYSYASIWLAKFNNTMIHIQSVLGTKVYNTVINDSLKYLFDCFTCNYKCSFAVSTAMNTALFESKTCVVIPVLNEVFFDFCCLELLRGLNVATTAEKNEKMTLSIAFVAYLCHCFEVLNAAVNVCANDKTDREKIFNQFKEDMLVFDRLLFRVLQSTNCVQLIAAMQLQCSVIPLIGEQSTTIVSAHQALTSYHNLVAHYSTLKALNLI